MEQYLKQGLVSDSKVLDIRSVEVCAPYLYMCDLCASNTTSRY